MGLLNGLKNGYPTYFMYQPSKGIDWGTLLNYQAATGRRTVKSTKTTTTTPQKPITGPQRGVEQWYQDQYNISQRKDALINNFAAQARGMSTEELYNSPIFKDFVNGMSEIKKLNYQQLANQNALKQFGDNANNVLSKLNDNGTGQNVAIADLSSIVGNSSYNSEGLPGAGPVAYQYDQDGNKIPIPAFVKDKKGKMIWNDQAQGLFNNTEFVNWQQSNIEYGPDHRPQTFVTPFLYQENNVNSWLDKLAQESSGKYNSDVIGNIMTLSAPTNNKDVPIENVSFYQNLKTNFDQLTQAVNSAYPSLTQSMKAELISQQASDIISGTNAKILDNGKIKTIDIKNLSPEQYAMVKMTGLTSPKSSRTRTLSKFGTKGGDGPKDNTKANFYDVIGNPLFADIHGDNVQMFRFIEGDDGKLSPKLFNAKRVKFGANARVLNEDFLGSKFPGDNYNEAHTIDQIASGNQLITLDGTLLDPKKFTGGRVLNFTGNIYWLPSYDKVQGKQVYNITGEPMKDGQGNIVTGTQNHPYYEMNVVMIGGDLKKYFNVANIDEKEIQSIIKSTTKNNSFDNIRDISKQINKLQQEIKEKETNTRFMSFDLSGAEKTSNDLDALWKDYDKEKGRLLNSKDISQEDKSSFFGSIDQTFILNPLKNKDIKESTGHYNDYVQEVKIGNRTGKIEFLGTEKMRRIKRKKFYKVQVLMEVNPGDYFDPTSTKENAGKLNNTASLFMEQNLRNAQTIKDRGQLVETSVGNE